METSKQQRARGIRARVSWRGSGGPALAGLIVLLGLGAVAPARATTTTISSPWTGSVPITIGAGDEVDIMAGGSVTNPAGAAVIVNGGTFNMSGGSVAGSASGVDDEGGTVTISGGTVSDRTSATPLGIADGVTINGGMLTISGGSVAGGVAGVSVASGTVDMFGGSVTSYDNGMIVGGGTVDVSGGSVSSPDYGVWVPGGTLNITGGSVVGGNSVVVAGGAVSVSGGLVPGRVAVGPGTAAISGGAVATTPGAGVFIYPGGLLSISGCHLILNLSTDRLTGTLLDGTPINTQTSGPAGITLNDHCLSTPPVANAGADRTLEATGPTTPVTLDGSGSNDPDGDTLTYAWSERTASLGSGQTLTVDLPLGTHTITLTVTDPGGATGTAAVTITVVDTTPPVISGTPGNVVAEATSPAGAAVSFASPTAVDTVDGPVAVICTPASGSIFPLGTTTVTCTATDAHHSAATTTFTVTVRDTIPPAITAAASPTTLWPPNGDMVPVTLSGSITDSGSGVNPASAMYAVVDDYGQVQPAGSVTLDAQGNYSVTIALEASRRGQDQQGRHYTITLRAADRAGNVGSAEVVVTVPHDQG